MIALALLLVVVVVVIVAVATSHRTAAPPPAAGDGPGAATDAAIAEALHRWEEAGLVSAEQAEAIRRHDALAAAPAPVTGPVGIGVAGEGRAPVAEQPAGPPHAHLSAVAEALGYLGGALALGGLVLIASRYWNDVATGARLVLVAVGTALLVAAGVLVGGAETGARARLRWSLWLLATAAAGLLGWVVAHDLVETTEDAALVAACALPVAVLSGVLWWGRVRPVQQFTCLVASAVAVGSLVTWASEVRMGGLAVVVAAWLFIWAGLSRRTPLPVLDEAVGALAVVVGSLMFAGDQEPGPPLLVLVGSALVMAALALAPQIRTSRVDRVVLLLGAGLAFFLGGTPSVGWAVDSVPVVGSAAVWGLGLVVVLLAHQRKIRHPVVMEGIGAATMVGGLAILGGWNVGAATILGLLNAVALVVVGTRPGRILLSVFGSIGLLVNVPWGIAHFFPGGDRAPLLILAAGLVVVAVSVLMTRQAGRFRTELGPHDGGLGLHDGGLGSQDVGPPSQDTAQDPVDVRDPGQRVS